MTRIRSIATLLGAAMLAACGEDAAQVIAKPLSGASIKFFNFAIATPPGTSTPQVNFFGNEAKLTAVSSTTGEDTLGISTGGVANGSFYSEVAPGQYTFTARIAKVTDRGLAIASQTATVASGEFYSFYMSGYYNTTSKTTDAFIVSDPLPALDYTVAYVRFVHASANANPMTLYAKNTTTNIEYPIGGLVSYKGAGAFTAVPPGSYNLATRYAGSGTDVVTRTGTSAVGLSGGRVYTIALFGDITVTSSTAANRIRLDFTTNR